MKNLVSCLLIVVSISCNSKEDGIVNNCGFNDDATISLNEMAKYVEFVENQFFPEYRIKPNISRQELSLFAEYAENLNISKKQVTPEITYEEMVAFERFVKRRLRH